LIAAHAAPATAQDWVQLPTASGQGGYFELVADGRRLTVGCYDTTGLGFVLLGGTSPLPPQVQADTAMITVSFTRADGTAAPYPIALEYMASDNALLGNFGASTALLDDFATARAIRISGANGALLLEAGMRGSGEARFVFGETCGL
jgi:hypothetical protein